MSTAKRIAKNTFFLFLGEIVDKLLSFFLIIIITRFLGSEGFGKYSFAFAFVLLFSIISNLGLMTYMAREIPRYKKDEKKIEKLVNNTLGLQIISSIIVFTISLIIAWFWPKSKEIFVVLFLVVIFEILNLTLTLVRTIFSSYEKNKFKLFSISIEKILALGLGGGALFLNFGIRGLLAGMVLSKLLSLITSLVWVRTYFTKISIDFNLKYIKNILKNSIPFWFGLVFIVFFYEIDKVMLTAFKGYEVTGWYGAAATLINALVFIPVVFIHATYPAMSRFFFIKNTKSLKLLYNKSVYYLLVISVPLTVGILLTSSRIVQFIYKEQFVESSIALSILSLVLVFIFVNHLMGYLLNSVNKQGVYSISMGIATLFNIVINFFLIPVYGYVGASIATVASQLINFLFLIFYLKKIGYASNFYKLLFKPFIASIIMGSAIFFMNSTSLWIVVPLSIVVYLLVLYLIKGISKDEISLIKSIYN